MRNCYIFCGLLVAFLSSQLQAKDNDFYQMDLRELLSKEVEIFSPGMSKSSDVKSVPGVVSIITQQDIERHGWRTLSEAIMSIPGFSQLHNDDEYLYAPRGIYATTNQKVLVMRDSHVLNEPVLDLVHLDYSIALDSIDRIEVIRGPGASVYGNAAMGAVINIVTRKGQFKKAKLRVGNFGQRDIEFSHGDKKQDYYYTVYGRYSNADGESRTLPPEQDSSADNPKQGVHKVGHYPNNLNLGFTAGIGELSFAASYQHDEMHIHWGLQGQNTNAEILVYQPRFELDTFHADVNYRHAIDNNLTATFNHYYDDAELFIIKNNKEITELEPQGTVREISWHAQKLGLNYALLNEYSEELTFNAGITYEIRDYGKNFINDYSATIIEGVDFYKPGKDYRGALYGQADWQVNPWFSLNLGLRADFFSDYDSSINPRLALLFNPIETVSAKLIYTTAFQTPGYSYQNSIAAETGSVEDLQPEELRSFQSVLRYEAPNKNYYFQWSYFYNRLDNLIQKPAAYRVNSGKFASKGYELEARWLINRWDIRGYYTYLQPESSYIDERTLAAKVFDGQFKHLASDVVYLSVNYHLLERVDINVNARYESSFINNQNVEESAKTIVNTTFLAKKAFYELDFSLSVYNLFDQQYRLGDAELTSQPQQGRWFMFGIAKNF